MPAALLLLAGLASSAFAQEAVPAAIVAQLDTLRQAWPDVPEAKMRDDARVEYSKGTIKIGSQFLAELERAPENESGVVLAFLLGHEGWHAVQEARHGAAELETMRKNRMRECEADFMGGAAAYRFLASKGLDEKALERAHHGLTAFVRTRAALAGGADTYPPPGRRAEAVAIGWGQAKSPALIRYEGRDTAPASEAERASETCRKIVEVSDRSSGMLEVLWSTERSPTLGDTETLRGSLENRSNRSIVASFLLTAWLYSYPPDPPGEQASRAPVELVAFDILDATLTVNPRQKIGLSFVVRRSVDDANYNPDAPRHASYAAMFPSFSSRYAAPDGQRIYCINNVATVPRSADRSLLARFAAIAAAANDDFDLVASDIPKDQPRGHRRSLIQALDSNGQGFISVGPFGAAAQVTLLRGDALAAAAEYSRVRALLEDVCGSGNVTETGYRLEAEPLQRALSLEAFAPKVRVGLYLWHYPAPAHIEGGPPGIDAILAVVFHRDPQQ